MGLILSVACLLLRKQTTTLGVMRNQSGGHLMSCFAIQVMEGDLQGDILERIIAAAYMNENAFNDGDHDDDGRSMNDTSADTAFASLIVRN